MSNIDFVKACEDQYRICRMKCSANSFGECVNIHVLGKKCEYDNRYGTVKERGYKIE